MNSNVFFYSGLSLLTLHEMDAIRCREWRIFPGLSLLSDKLGLMVFVFAHVPIFFITYWQLTHCRDLQSFITNFDVFMVVHVGLHILFIQHKKLRNNEFKDWISWIIIAGAGGCGVPDLVWR